MPVYANTSFLCSYSLPDANSGLALATLQSLSGLVIDNGCKIPRAADF
ncbi:MAG: hypothetical protein HYY24_14565 [Verrucomicrobia bacterium]|nr:hypothetical protein [Verrucomicrobiota bacterium]